MSGRGFTWSWRMRRHRQDRGLPTSTRSNGWPGDSTGPAAKQTFEAEEIERILTLALRKRNGVRFVIALALGLRQGEALSLKWSRLHKPRKGDVIARLELDSPPVSVPVKLDITGLMAELLTESPTCYNVSSGVTHSLYWGLRDAVASQPGEPVALTPDLLEVGAAAESAISAAGLILARCAAYYGHYLEARHRATAERRESIDSLMRPVGEARWAQRGRAM